MFQKIISFFSIEFHQNRIFGLDIIRATAIISVLLGHGALIIPGETGSIYATAYNFLDGVFVFFVLSGFLIGEILIYTLENKPITKETLVTFWKRRLLRTVPAYYITIVVLFIFYAIYSMGFGGLNILLYFVFLQNFCTSHPFFFAEAWTLSIEVWFYILIPLLVFVLKGYFKLSDKKSIMIPIVVFILFGFLMRLFRAYTYTEIDGTIIDQFFRKQVVTRIDSVTFGVLGAYIYKYYKSFWENFKYLFLVLGISIFLYTKYPIFEHGKLFKLVFFYTLQSLSFLLIIPFFNSIKSGKGVFYIIMTTLSYVSFSIYLLNLNFIQVFILDKINFGSITGVSLQIVKYVLYIFLSIFGGIVMYKNVEIPFMKLRKKG